jgi:hypothetical protein
VRNDADITFNSSATYTSDTPSVNPNETTKYSIGQSALHEFGHALGLDDAGWQIGTMNGNYPGGGDLGTGLKYRINEDDYVGLVAAKGDSSTGVNLMLLRFSYNTTNNLASEIWSNQTWAADKTENWEGHPGGSPSASNSPNDVYAVYVGTGSDNPVIKWRLSPDNICFSGTEYVIGSRTPGLSANDPYLVGPSGGFTIPSLTPPGLYYVCAMIDATFVVEETDENDNIIVSEKTFSVLP